MYRVHPITILLHLTAINYVFLQSIALLASIQTLFPVLCSVLIALLIVQTAQAQSDALNALMGFTFTKQIKVVWHLVQLGGILTILESVNNASQTVMCVQIHLIALLVVQVICGWQTLKHALLAHLVQQVTTLIQLYKNAFCVSLNVPHAHHG